MNTVPQDTKKPKRKAVTPGDLFPGYNWGKTGKTGTESLENMTNEQKMNYYRMLNAMLGGREVELEAS